MLCADFRPRAEQRRLPDFTDRRRRDLPIFRSDVDAVTGQGKDVVGEARREEYRQRLQERGLLLGVEERDLPMTAGAVTICSTVRSV